MDQKDLAAERKARKEAQQREKKAKLEAKKAAAKAKKAAQSQNKDKQSTRSKPVPVSKAPIDKTPKGEKKDLSGEFPSSYYPIYVESAWYEWWEAQGFFKPDNPAFTSGRNPSPKTFSMVIPPPNVTGNLHIGHALTNSIQDCLVRWNRMKGNHVLWIPGTDHAGIATQTVVEKRLFKDHGKTRHDYSREEFVGKVWEWKEQYGGTIINQLRRIGSSVDWSRSFFSLDDHMAEAVTEAFVKMYDDGLIYRSTRLVNWCPQLSTAIADIEVDHMELSGPTRVKVPGHGDKTYEVGIMVDFAYKFVDSDEELVISTTRPETMLGDTAVAVHPEDERYKKFHGKFLVHPFVDRKIPIVCDATIVKMDLGTGAVKITPAHDPNDYECGKRHNLPFINILNDDGTLNDSCGEFKGLKRFDARVAVVKKLQELDLYRGKKPNPMSIGICSRSKDIIEPMLKPQWWVKCDTIAARAAQAVRDGDLKITPSSHEATWFRWLDNIRDWCISRQLWWGHRIPAFLVSIEGQEALDTACDDSWVVGRTKEEALSRAAERFKVEESKITLTQDHDVLDTWFSSGLFPFSSLGWPNKESEDFKQFFPTHTLETGYDILFFWVARMVMCSYHLTGQLPFKEVLLHSIVRDAHGKKMSKATGNVIDPVHVIEGRTLQQLHETLQTGNLEQSEIAKAIAGQKKDYPKGIPECGTDALRFSLCNYTSQGRYINMDINKVVNNRKFCNKLWNATKFMILKLGDDFVPNETAALTGKESAMDKWILKCANNAAVQANQSIETFDLYNATFVIHSFWLNQLCDVYVEAIKPITISGTPDEVRASQDTLYTCLDIGLRLLHPFMPFVTEELFQRIPRRPKDTLPSIMVFPYPEDDSTFHDESFATIEQEVADMMKIVKAARGAKATYEIKRVEDSEAFFKSSSSSMQQTFEKYRPTILTLAGCSSFNLVEELPAGCVVDVLDEVSEVYLQVKGRLDLNAEIVKIEKKLESNTKDFNGLNKKINGPMYKEKASEDAQAIDTAKLTKLTEEKATLESALTALKKLLD